MNAFINKLLCLKIYVYKNLITTSKAVVIHIQLSVIISNLNISSLITFVVLNFLSFLCYIRKNVKAKFINVILSH